METQPLLDLLKDEKKIVWGQNLFLKGEYPWKPDSPAVIVDLDQDEKPDKLKKSLESDGLKYIFITETVQDIVSNLKQQVSSPTDDQLLEAFNFYFRNDAFIEIKHYTLQSFFKNFFNNINNR